MPPPTAGSSGLQQEETTEEEGTVGEGPMGRTPLGLGLGAPAPILTARGPEWGRAPPYRQRPADAGEQAVEAEEVHQVKDKDHDQVADGDHFEVAVGAVADPHRAPHADEGDQQSDLDRSTDTAVTGQPTTDAPGAPGGAAASAGISARAGCKAGEGPVRTAPAFKTHGSCKRCPVALSSGVCYVVPAGRLPERGQARRKRTEQNHSVYLPSRRNCRKLPVLDRFGPTKMATPMSHLTSWWTAS